MEKYAFLLYILNIYKMIYIVNENITLNINNTIIIIDKTERKVSFYSFVCLRSEMSI